MINQETKDELVKRVISWIVDDAKSRDQVIKMIREDIGKDSEDKEVNDLIRDALNRIGEMNITDPVQIVRDHVASLEYIYAYFKKIGNASGMNKALQAKEKLLRISKDENKLVFHNKQTTIIEASNRPTYDLTKLTVDELRDYNELMAKAMEDE